jgi:hypothetical protein
MTDGQQVWNKNGKKYADPGLEKSAFIIFVEFCSDQVLDPSEAGALVKQRWSLKPSIFHLSEEVATELGKAMGIEPALWMQARGTEFLASRAGKRVFVSDLRYCHSCLALGNHSTLFQLPQVAHCPVHDEPLRIGCPHCGQPISTNALAIARNHLYCGSCDRNFATERRRASVGGPVGHPPVERFAALRRVVAEQARAGESRSVLRWDKSPSEIVANPVLVRWHHAHTIWGDPAIGSGFLRFKTESCRLDAEDPTQSRTKFYALVRGAVITAFEELAAQVAKHVRLNEVPAGVEGAMHSAARVDIRISAVAAAFWQAAAAFNVHRFVLGEMPPPAAKPPPFWSWLPEHTAAMRLVVRHEVEALFVRSLLRMRGLRFGVQVAWAELPDEAHFLLPWRLRAVAGSTQQELQIRTKVDAPTVDRLVSRYRRHWLLEAPDDVSTLGLVTASVAAASEEGVRPPGPTAA